MLTGTAIVATIGLLPLYLAVRWPYFKLPLHMDTGYYVSNPTICSRQLDFSKGWNATYAGCSKVVPEFFYSWIFLLHGTGARYRFFSRFYYSLYAYAVAVATGVLASALHGGDLPAYLVGLLVCALLVSEPRYGIYFESGEQFELLPQVIGALLIYRGLDTHDGLMVGAGVGIWVLESFFIKLSSLPAAAVFGAATGVLLPQSLPYSLGFSLLAALGYLGWLLYNGKHPLALLKPIIGHERHFGHRIGLIPYVERVISKIWFLFYISFSHPVIPSLAVFGALASRGQPLLQVLAFIAVALPVSVALERLPSPSRRGKMIILLLYLALLVGSLTPALAPQGFMRTNLQTVLLALYVAAVFVSYLVQAAQVWYYTIPFLPIIAVLATNGVLALLDLGWPGAAVSAGLLILWGFLQVWRPARMSVEELNRWTWLPHPTVPDRNLALERAAPELQRTIGAEPLLVYGHYNQAYALVGSSYPVSLISPNVWLDVMHPNWEEDLHRRLVTDPPKFILDSDACFDHARLRESLGLRYRRIKEFPGEFTLYRLDGASVTETSRSRGQEAPLQVGQR